MTGGQTRKPAVRTRYAFFPNFTFPHSQISCALFLKESKMLPAVIIASLCRPTLPPRVPRMCVREHRAGSPAGPQVSADIVCVRYMYDGGKMSQGRLCRLTPSHHEKVTGQEVLDVLAEDGVDLARFYACVCNWVKRSNERPLLSALVSSQPCCCSLTSPCSSPSARRRECRFGRFVAPRWL